MSFWSFLSGFQDMKSAPYFAIIDLRRKLRSHLMTNDTTRRNFLKQLSAGSAFAGFAPFAVAQEQAIQGFDETETTQQEKVWEPFSDRKIRVGIVGFGVCHFGAAFSFQHHPQRRSRRRE
jgi:hypothetical protein